MNKVDFILNQKESNGLRITLIFRIVMLIIMTIVHVFSRHSDLELVRVAIISGFFLLLSIFFLYLIRKGNHLRLVGYLGLSVDAFIMCFLPYNWYLSVGFYENVPATYLLKTSLPNITFIFIGLNALALRPLYPLIIATIFNVIWLFFFYLVFNDPRTVFTESFIDNFFTPSILPGYYITFMVTVTGLGSILAYLTRSYRNSIHEAVNLEVQNNQLERYFSPNVLRQIIGIESIFQAKKSKIVVLFSDIRGFTAISEALNAEEVVSFLREYHSMMVEIIYQHGGTIDKFIGDGIMVTFGTPKESKDDCERAMLCAISMHSALNHFNTQRKAQNLAEIKQGIGIHYGEAVSGNIGSENRLEYTVIGDTVNLASRIESQCKDLEKDILFTESFAKEIAPSHSIISVGKVEIRGKKNSIELFTISQT